jgi:hypothetical protein
MRLLRFDTTETSHQLISKVAAKTHLKHLFAVIAFSHFRAAGCMKFALSAEID